MERPYYYVYEITNNINGKYYRGVHSTENLNDGYMGSGHLIKAAIEKYGIENFTKTILEFFDTASEAYSREAELVTMKEVNDPMCYNLRPGGKGGRERIYTDEELKRHAYEYMKDYSKQYYETNKEQILEKQRKYQRTRYQENKERRREYNSKRKEANNAYMKEYRNKNRESIREYQRIRYQRKNQQKENTIL